eukprot:TRINITY_DN7722_c0_g4_i2.p2 TRINITY_DN7722_c0_g4~~TRINITY_DN7722_c0_g4_i2.p2  ORF type:complete len:140 (+),score=17.41 TRINITY_DN7722_c0_g4_i2:429-848(+)
MIFNVFKPCKKYIFWKLDFSINTSLFFVDFISMNNSLYLSNSPSHSLHLSHVQQRDGSSSTATLISLICSPCMPPKPDHLPSNRKSNCTIFILIFQALQQANFPAISAWQPSPSTVFLLIRSSIGKGRFSSSRLRSGSP